MLDWLIDHSPLLYFTQSLWRDEAFSILAAQKPLTEILPKLGFEPPVYYTLLHIWMKIFGTSEIATRSLSLLGLTLATVVVIVWAEKLFTKHWLSWFTPLFFFTNPMLLYYGFEVRTYGWYILFATLTMYAYWNSRWMLLVTAATLGFYTHTYFVFVPLTLCVHWAWINRKKLYSPGGVFGQPFIRSLVLWFLLVSPWLMKIIREMGALQYSWYFPVNFNLVRSVLGNMFVGYEGTPWFGWEFTRIISLVLLGFFLFAQRSKKNQSRNGLFFLMIFLPLTIVIGVSFLKPLFVNRYLIPVTIAEVLLLVFALEAVKNETLKKTFAFILLTFTLLVNAWYPAQHAKLDIRTTIREVNSIARPDDLYYAESSLVFLESMYYAKDKKRVFFYDPNRSGFPWYVGSAVFSDAYVAKELPLYPARAFLIREDGSYTVLFQTPFVSRV